jgi:hypothetical protein
MNAIFALGNRASAEDIHAWQAIRRSGHVNGFKLGAQRVPVEVLVTDLAQQPIED